MTAASRSLTITSHAAVYEKGCASVGTHCSLKLHHLCRIPLGASLEWFIESGVLVGVQSALARVFLAFSVLAISLSVSVVIAPESKALKYKNCKQVRKDYPNGVAYNEHIASLATQDGLVLARANRKLVSRIRLAWSGKKYDNAFKYDLLIACARKAKQSVPSPVSYAWGDYDYQEDEINLYWGAPENRGFAGRTNYIVRGVVTDGLIFSDGQIRFSREARALRAEPDREYVFDIVAVNDLGESEPVRVVVNTGLGAPSQRPAYLDTIPYYATCFTADADGVTPILEITKPDLYDRNKHLDRDGDGVGCEPTWWSG